MEFLVIFILTGITGTLLTGLAMRLNIFDEPNYRKIHSKAIPKAGGIGIVVPVLLVMIWYVSDLNENMKKEFASIILITLLLLFVGIVDYKIELSARKKFLFQLLASAVTASAGIYFHLCDNYYINYFVTIIWIVGFINALNLIDGLDGLAGGIGLIASIGILFFSYKYASGAAAITATALMGSLLGFLLWNRHPAKIFMGDTGSMPLGYLLASLIVITGNAIGGFGGAAIALFMVAVPIYDTMLSIIRRKINKRPIFSPDRSHFYNLLMDQIGISHKNTVLLLYLISLSLVISAVVLNYLLPIYRYVLAVLLLIAAAVGSIKAGFLKVDKEGE